MNCIRSYCAFGRKKPAGLAPENPEPVKQMNLNISGYTSLARMIEQLETNSHYASCLFETEMEAVTNTLFQDYGNYGYLLNQAAHHERIGNSTKTNGSLLASYPLLSMLLTGTPEMFRRLVPSAESGLFSRLMVYKIAGHGEYRPLTSEDDTPAAAIISIAWRNGYWISACIWTSILPGFISVIRSVNG